NKLSKFEKEADTGKLAKKGDTIEELATALDIDPETLADTITRYNSFVELGRDEDFGRKELQAKFENGPFYAIQTYVYTMSSMGGLTVNTDFQVLDTNGHVIPGLYAAGMTAGGVHGERMGSGNGIGWGLTSGRLAGSSIVDHL
ncbi:MAG: FAD-binding protein, partial [Bacillota bacterium]